MDSHAWDERYAADAHVWGHEPNRFVVDHAGDLPPGRVVDLACGPGRNALYLAARGHRVTGVDFSATALERARAADPDGTVTWVHADITSYRPDPTDLALLAYAHLPADQRRATLQHATAALDPGGRILVIGHASRNLTDGTGGPQDPEILFSVTDILDDLGRVAPDLLVEVAAEPTRPVPGADRPAIDVVVLAQRP